MDLKLLGSLIDSCCVSISSLPLWFRPLSLHPVPFAGELQDVLALRTIEVDVVVFLPVDDEEEELTAFRAESLSLHHFNGFSFPFPSIFFPVSCEPWYVGVVTARHNITFPEVEIK